MEKKFVTLNNWVSKKVVDNLIENNFRAVFYLLYNCGYLLDELTFNRTCAIIYNWYDKDVSVIHSDAYEFCGPDVSAFITKLFKDPKGGVKDESAGESAE